MTRVSISEFGIVQKGLAHSTVTFYVTDENGVKTSTKATIYSGPSGSSTLPNPQTLDENGQLESTCYVETTIMAEISNYPAELERRSIQKIRQSPFSYALPITSGGIIGSQLGATAFQNVFVGEGTSAPTTGTYAIGNIWLNSNPSVGGNWGWICLVSGTPGTWYELGLIGA